MVINIASGLQVQVMRVNCYASVQSLTVQYYSGTAGTPIFDVNNRTIGFADYGAIEPDSSVILRI